MSFPDHSVQWDKGDNMYEVFVWVLKETFFASPSKVSDRVWFDTFRLIPGKEA